MLILVLYEEDKEKMLLSGANLVSTQNINGEKAYLFDIGNKKNFDLSGIRYIQTNKIYF